MIKKMELRDIPNVILFNIHVSIKELNQAMAAIWEF